MARKKKEETTPADTLSRQVHVWGVRGIDDGSDSDFIDEDLYLVLGAPTPEDAVRLMVMRFQADGLTLPKEWQTYYITKPVLDTMSDLDEDAGFGKFVRVSTASPNVIPDSALEDEITKAESRLLALHEERKRRDGQV